MTLLDELAAERSARGGGRCQVADLYQKLDADTAGELRAALGDQTLPATVISEVLGRRGHDISGRSLQYHRRQRRGGCKCDSL